MDDTLPLQFVKVKDDARFDKGGAVVREKLYTFWLGEHGPFQFRTPADPFDESAFTNYVSGLRNHLRGLATL